MRKERVKFLKQQYFKEFGIVPGKSTLRKLKKAFSEFRVYNTTELLNRARG